MLTDKAQALIEYAGMNGRLCLQPHAWSELWKLLPDKVRNSSGGWEPPLPLILGAWWHTTGLEKTLRLRDHIEWADSHGNIEEVDAFLRGLPEHLWFHISDC